MDIEKYVRQLAKTQNMQNIFFVSKELNGIKIFMNEVDFSKIQHSFLSYLYFYHNLHRDISMKEVNKKVLDDEIFEDAYSYYKIHKVEKSPSAPKGVKKLEGVFSKDNKINFPK